MTGITRSYNIKVVSQDVPSKGSQTIQGDVIEGRIIGKNHLGTKVLFDGLEVLVEPSVKIMEAEGANARFQVVSQGEKSLGLTYLPPLDKADEGFSLNEKSPVKGAEVQKDYQQVIGHAVRNLPEDDQQKVSEMVESTTKALTETVDLMTDDDVRQMLRDGFNVEKTSIEIVAGVLSHNKAMVQQGDMAAIEAEVEQAMDQLKEGYGDQKQLKTVVQALKSADLPIKKKYVDKVLAGLEKVDQVKSLASEDTYKLLRAEFDDDERISLGRVYKVLNTPDPQASDLPVTDLALSQLVQDHLVKEGIPLTAENIEAAKAMVRHSVGISADKISFAITPEKVTSAISEEAIIEAMVDKIAHREDINDVEISELDFLKATHSETTNAGLSSDHQATVDEERLETIIDLLGQTKDAHMVQAVRTSHKENLQEVLSLVEGASSESPQNLKTESLDELESTLHLKRQLEEIRLKMTLSSALRLEKQGIKVETAPLERVVQGLRDEEAALQEVQLKAYGSSLSTEEAEIYKTTMSSVKASSAYHQDTMAYVIQQKMSVTFNQLEEASMVVSDQEMTKAYEGSMTEVRTDLGDRLENTFGQIEAMLTSMGLEATESQVGAAKILARNSMPITEENLLAIQMTQEKVDLVTAKMTPSLVVKMIQANMNPTALKVDELMSYIQAYEDDLSLTDGDKISALIYKLDQSKTMSSEERRALMAIYRTLDTVVRSKGAATGFLVKNGMDLTINELFEAAKYSQKTHHIGPSVEATIGDGFGYLEEVTNQSEMIREQVLNPLNQQGGSGQSIDQLKSELMTVRLSQFVLSLSESKGETLVKTEDFVALKGESLEALTKIMDQWQEKPSTTTLIDQSETYLNFVKSNPDVLKTLLNQQIPMTFENFSKAMALNEAPFTLLDDLEKVIEGIKDQEVQAAAVEKLTSRTMEVLKGRAPYEDLEGLIDDIKAMIQDSPGEEEASVYKNVQGVKDTVDHVQMLQITEDYYQIPLMMEGQMTQLNLFFLHEEGHVASEDDEMTLLMHFKTRNMGRVQSVVKLRGNNLSLEIQADDGEDQDMLREVEDRFREVLEAGNFNVTAISYGSVEMKEPIEFNEAIKARPKNNHVSGHIDRTV